MAGHHDGTRKRLDAKVAELGLLDLPDRPAPEVTDADLAPLPRPARRWLRRAGVLGRPRVRTFRLRFDGEIRMKPGQAWMPLTAWQLNTVDPIARLFQMRVTAAHLVPMVGADRYVEHTGEMHGRVLGLVTVADGRGREFDLGELVTWLNDAVVLAPSMLLRASTTWVEVDDRSFDLTLVDGDNTVTARVVLGDDGLVSDFVTEDRWYAGADPPTRTPWHTPFSAWTDGPDGRPFPGPGQGVWSFPDGDFTYVRGSFEPTTFEVDVRR